MLDIRFTVVRYTICLFNKLFYLVYSVWFCEVRITRKKIVTSFLVAGCEFSLVLLGHLSISLFFLLILSRFWLFYNFLVCFFANNFILYNFWLNLFVYLHCIINEFLWFFFYLDLLDLLFNQNRILSRFLWLFNLL